MVLEIAKWALLVVFGVPFLALALFLAIGTVLAALMYIGKAAEWCLRRMERGAEWVERTWDRLTIRNASQHR